MTDYLLSYHLLINCLKWIFVKAFHLFCLIHYPTQGYDEHKLYIATQGQLLQFIFKKNLLNLFCFFLNVLK